MRRAVSAVVLVLGVLGVVACDEELPATAVMIQIEADNAVESLTRDVDIRIFGRGPDEAFPDEPVQLINVVVDDVGWPLTHTLVPRGGELQRLYKVEATANDGMGMPIAHVRAISGYVSQRVLVLRLRFYSTCLYLDPCVQPELSCGPDGECSEPAQRLPQNLPSIQEDGGITECTNSEVDCDDGVACTDDACVEGTCVNRPDDTRCVAGTGGRCDALDDCQYPVCDATTCAPAACQEVVCEGSTCMRTNACDEGAPCCDGVCCDVGEICCGGVCSLLNCNDMNRCTDDACTSSGCQNTVNATATCDDGLFCTSGDHCQTDGSCGGAATCSAMLTCDEALNTCVGECRIDSDCGMPMTVDVGSCSYPPCSATGSGATMTTTPRCVGLMCTTVITNGMRACTRTAPMEGSTCGTASWSMLGPCVGACGRSDGMQSGMRTDHTCMSGTCTTTSQTATQMCMTAPCTDGGVDAGPPDAGFDAGRDGGFDAGHDGGPMDAGSDACLGCIPDGGLRDSRVPPPPDAAFSSGG